MKKSLLIAAAGMVLSVNAFATEYTQESASKSLRSEGFEVKQEAYDAGFVIIDELESLSKYELRHEIATAFAENIEIDSAEVKIEEFSTSQGNVQYRAVVNVDYSYEEEARKRSND